jgi:hypothetical protein
MRSITLLLAAIPAVAHADSFTVEAGVGVGEQLGVTPTGRRRVTSVRRMAAVAMALARWLAALGLDQRV